ncbi:MAG: hypothetical protein ACRCXT_16255 [Paraclostridium sp.]
MSPLAKEVIEALSNEEDEVVLAEVLNFYEYLKDKKKKQLNKIWNNVEEVEPTKEEIEIINGHIESNIGDSISLDDLSRDLGIKE